MQIFQLSNICFFVVLEMFFLSRMSLKINLIMNKKSQGEEA